MECMRAMRVHNIAVITAENIEFIRIITWGYHDECANLTVVMASAKVEKTYQFDTITML